MKRLVVFAPNWLGDAVMALPAIADVRRHAAGVTMAVAARPAVAPLFAMVNDVDEVIETGTGKGVVPLFRTIELKKGYDPFSAFFDTALLLPNSFRSALIALRAGIPDRWGYPTDWRGPLLTRAVDRAPAGMHQVDYYQQLVRSLGFPTGPSEPRLEVSPEIRDAAARVLEQAGWDGEVPIVALAPGASYGSAKRWPPEYFAELARALAGDGVRPVFVGGAADRPTGREIEAALGDTTTVLNVIGLTDIPTLAGVLVHARALVSNDSGAMHVGAAVGLPVTAVFGPLDERLTGPRGVVRLKPDATHTVLTHPVWCRPCMLRECPLDHRCMRGVHVNAVLDATRRML